MGRGTWYFATLAYQYGPHVILSQIPWCLSIIGLALLLPLIITNIRGHTLHGFLGRRFGLPTQRIAAVATTIGYFVNGGFELCWASYLFALCIGRPDLRLMIALGLALIVGVYCTIGGYRSNASVDKPHNILGVLSLAGLVVALFIGLRIQGPLLYAAALFCLGSIVYSILSVLSYRGPILRDNGLNAVAVAFAIGGLIIVYALLRPGAVGGSADARGCKV